MEKKISLFMLIGFLFAIPCSFFFPSIIVESEFFGKLFLDILKFIVPFVIFISISFSIASFSTNTKLKKMVPMTLILYVLSTTLAITFSLLISSQINFPVNPDLVSELNFDSSNKLNIQESIEPLGLDLLNLPRLIIDGNPLAIMIFAICCGILIKLVNNKKTIEVLSFLNDSILSSIMYFMWLAPIAIFSLFGNLLIGMDYKIIFILLKF